MLIRQTLQYAPAQFVGPLAQFIGAIVWTHVLQPADYGFVLLILAVQELGYVLGLSWWSSYTLRYLPSIKDRDAYQRCENAMLVLMAIAQLPVVLIGLAWTGHLADLSLGASAFAYAASRAVLSHLSERARAVGDIPAYTAAQTLGPLLGLPLGLGLLHLLAPALAITWGFAVVQIATLPFVVWRLKLDVTPRFRINREHLRAALRYGGPLLAAGGFSWLATNGIRFVVDYREGAVALGLLSVGWNLGQRLMTVIATLVTAAAFPLAVRSYEERGLEQGLAQLSGNAVLLTGLLIPAALGVAAVATPLTLVMVGPEFRDATLAVLPLAAAGAALRNVRIHFPDQVFLLIAKPGFILALNIVEAVATLIACAIGLRWGGLVGACLGCIVVYGTSALVSFVVAMARYRLEVPLGPMLRFAAASLVMVAAIGIVTLPPTVIGLVAKIGFGSLVYGALSFILLRGMLPSVAGAFEPRPRKG